MKKETAMFISFERSMYNTTVMRSCGMDGTHGNDDDIITTVQYDNMGRAISQQMKFGSGNEIGAGSVAYTTSDSDETSSGFKNKVSGSGATGKYVENLLYGGNAESTSGWNPSKSGTITYEPETSSASKYIGKKSIKLSVTAVESKNARCYFRQNYTDNIKSDTEYTLSAYVKTGDLEAASDASLTGAFIQIIGYDENGDAISSVNSRSQILTERTDLDVNDGWRRLTCTVRTNSDVVSLRCYLFLRNTKGSVCFDGIQLEKGGTANDFNMLENSHFTMLNEDNEPLSWEGTSKFTFDDDNGVETTSGTTGKNTKAVIVTGSPDVEKGVTQTVTVEGNPDDTYILSAWAKGYPVNSTYHLNNKDEEIATFEIAVKVNYSASDGTSPSQLKNPASFNTTITDWQCASVPISLQYTGGKKDVTYTPQSIKIIPRYHNQENFVYFDKIMLVKDAASSYTYDDKGNIISASSNSEQKANMKYDDENNLTSYTDAAGFTTTATYYSNNNLKLTKSDGDFYTKYNYNDSGSVSYTENRNSAENESATAAIRTNNDYNEETTSGGVTIKAGAYQTKYRDQNNRSTNYTRDHKTGTLTSVTDAKDVVTNYEYYPTNNNKAFGMPKSVATGSSKVTYEYNDNEQLDKIIFGNTIKEEYSFEYDNFGNVAQTLVGSQSLSANTYEENNGVLLKTEYGNGDSKRFMYNDLGQLRRVYSKDGTASEKLLYSWSYNDSGVNTSYVDRENDIKVLYDFDSLGRLSKTETQERETGVYIGSTEFSYDIRNNLTGLITNYGGVGVEQKYYYSKISENQKSADYEKDNLPTMYKLYSSRYAIYDYDELNRLVQRDFSTKTHLFYNYIYKKSDNRNTSGSEKYQTTQVKEEYIGNDVYIYGYDVLGYITSIKTATRSGDRANSTNHTTATDYASYTYDDLGQLTRENLAGKKTTAWTYDILGNITSKSEYAYTMGTLGTATKTVTYGYGKDGKNGWNNLLVSVDANGNGTTDSGETINYDKIGNPTTYLGATLTWNGRQLTSYTKGDTISYKYDADGLRTLKSVNGAKTKYYYVNGKLHYEERSDGTKLYFFYDSNGYLTCINHNGSTNYYPATNLRGDVVALYRHTGALLATYEYDAWGNVIAVKDATGNAITDQSHIANLNPIRYRGYYYDTETKLYYLQSRYYNAEVGRFLNADGYLTTGQGVLSYNMFAYCGNNPVMYSDPSGCSWEDLRELLQPLDELIYENVVKKLQDSKNKYVRALGNALDFGKTVKDSMDPFADLKKNTQKVLDNADRIKEQYVNDILYKQSGKELTHTPDPYVFKDVEKYNQKCSIMYSRMFDETVNEFNNGFSRSYAVETMFTWDPMTTMAIGFVTAYYELEVIVEETVELAG